MKIEVRYLSKSGNTAKIAESIANAVGARAKTIDEPVAGTTDLLILGGAVYAFGIDDELKGFIAKLPTSVKQVAVFSTTAVVKTAYPHIAKLLRARGITVSEREFHCRGAFKFMHKGRPNEEDLANAVKFAKDVANAR
ncbi:MAG: flavodoxin [Clostridiales bacterium]|jgi:flavodoxin|nr:flavodoxin [Clostridiales bacterium]